jgi:DNA-binding GntR family transcriptional regulator
MSKETGSTSLTKTAYERLRADLLSCRLAPGERLNINDLCQSMGLNLSAVREALAKLTAEGLVIAEPQRGFRVAAISVDELRDLTSVRIEIESLCLRRAMTLGDVSWEATVLSAYHILTRTDRMAVTRDAAAAAQWWAVHADYHRALVSACGSPWLLRVRETLFAQSERYRMLSVPLGGTVPRNVEKEHADITEAVLARDIDRATGLMTSHLELTTHYLLKSGAGQVEVTGETK